LAQNKGYSTPDHISALERIGPTSLHRFSFEPVRASSARPEWTGYPALPPNHRQRELFACP
jgi:ribonuclease HII